tara:strand:+ start:885 stop:2090 length:1206 start_codon:yes stop_codon:yes gene_type:complete
MLIVFLLATSILIALLNYLPNIIGFFYPSITEDKYPLFILGLLTAYFNLFQGSLTNILRAREKAKIFMFLQIFITIIGILITLIEVIILERGAYGLLESSLITSCIAFIMYLFSNLREFSSKINLKILKRPIIFSIPLIPHSLFTLTFYYSDRLILEKYVTLTMIGLYFFSSKISDMVKLFVVEFNNSFLPHYNKTAVNNITLANNELKKISLTFIYLVSFLVIFIGLFSFEIIYILFDERYLESWKIIPLLSVGYIFVCLYNFSNIHIFFQKNTKMMPIITFLGASVSILLNIILIQIYGIYGAAYTFIISHAFILCITFFIVKRLYGVDLEQFKLSIIVIFSVISIIISQYINSYYFKLDIYTIYLIKFMILSVSIFLGFHFKIIKDLMFIRRFILNER